MDVTGANLLDTLRRTEETNVPDSGNGTLTQADFFSLLTQELAFQDPTSPADNNEIISQVTAFSTTNGVAELNGQFGTFASSASSSQALQASSLVGQTVLVNENNFNLEDGDSPKGKLATDLPSIDTTVTVTNAAGEIIQTIPVGNIDAGEFNFEWDGLQANGEKAPEGTYNFVANGLVDGTRTELQALTYRKVDSVTLAGANGIVLNLNGGTTMSLADVVEVSES